MTKPIKIRRALISVSDKENLLPLVEVLIQYDVEIISTGGTATFIKEAGFAVREIKDITQFPEIMSGRVKSLHPLIHGAILGDRVTHVDEAKNHEIHWIDLVVCNLYPFESVIAQDNTSLETAIEHIDIGGPSMIRAAAKNFRWVTILTHPQDYPAIISEFQEQEGKITYKTRLKLSAHAFQYTSYYDGVIANYFKDDKEIPKFVHANFILQDTLRYGENPHQRAALYRQIPFKNFEDSLPAAKLLQGKPLSYNNIADADAGLACLGEFSSPACVVIKHATPCGIAAAQDINDAFEKAFTADEISAFGGIIALNRPCTAKIASFLKPIFFELIIAPDFETEALMLFKEKSALRVLKLTQTPHIPRGFQLKPIHGGLLIQDYDNQQLSLNALQEVTQKTIDAALLEDLYFAWHSVKHVKSNAIVIAQNQVTLGIGGGQVSRIDAVEMALQKAKNKIKRAVLASDAFFPFRDSIDKIAQYPIAAIIQSGGSVKDSEVIEACNQHGIAMIFTGTRAFKH
jgi:phosphoribosylaminoimidazolecarboxamide formyltransferase / IMP cyclohydrolase